jgi:hypothetical protein
MASHRDELVIEQIWRYPVKSLRGERLSASRVDERSTAGDRLWAIRDTVSGKLGSGKNTRLFRRFPGPPLLELSSHYPVESQGDDIDGLGPPMVVGADGRRYPVVDGSADLFIQQYTGVPTLHVVRESDIDHFDDGPVSLIGTATMRWVEELLPGTPIDARRFRPNFVVRTTEPFEEEAWIGRTLRIGAPGGVALAVRLRHTRCLMVSTEQADLPQAPEVLKLVASRADQPLKLAVASTVARPGRVAVGDSVFVDDAVFDDDAVFENDTVFDDDAALDDAVLVDGGFMGESVPAAEQ